MGPHEKNKLKKDVDKWLSKDPLIKESMPTHVGVKPKKPIVIKIFIIMFSLFNLSLSSKNEVKQTFT